MGRGEGPGERGRGSEGQVGLLVAFAGRGPFWIFLLRSNFPYAPSPTDGDLGNPEGGRIPDSLGPSLALASVSASFPLLATRGPASPLRLARPRGLGISAPPTAPASVSPGRVAPGSGRPTPVPWVWLGSLPCRGRQSRGSAFWKGSAFSGRWGGGLAWPRCPVSGWHWPGGGTARQEMSAVLMPVAFGPWGGLALQGRGVSVKCRKLLSRLARALPEEVP